MNFKLKCVISPLVILIFAFNFINVNSVSPLTAIDIAKYGFNGIRILMGLKTTLNNMEFKKKVMDSLSKILETTRKIETLLTAEADRVIKELSIKFDMSGVNDFAKIVHKINQRYEKKYIKYFFNNNNNTYQLTTIQRFVDETLDENGFKKIMEIFNALILPQYYLPYVEDKRLFDILSDYYGIKQSHNRDCNEGSAQLQQLFSVYNLAALTLVRGYTMIIHAYIYQQQQASNLNSWVPEIRDEIEEFRKTLLQIADISRNTMNKSSKEIRRCDPSRYIDDSNYIRLKNFLSVFLTTQTAMNTHSCTGKCGDYKRLGSIYSKHQKYSSHFTCDGTAHDCWTTSVSQICLAEPESGRRFEALTENYGMFDLFKHYRRGVWTDRCAEKTISPNDFITNDPLCSICACYCDEWRTAGSLRSFSLREQFTDILDSRVVTGVRFKVKDNVIYLEIQEGKLLNGSIDLSTVRWNPEANYLPQVGSEVVQLNYNIRSLNLDDIALPIGYVMTGIKLAFIRNRLILAVAGVKMYDESGHPVTPGKMQWYYPNNLERTELILNKPDVPTQSIDVNVEESIPGKHFIQFQVSDWDKDASQTVVPYIDSQEVFSEPATPLGGVGIYYKSHPGSGGFISLKLLAFNYSIFISEENLSEIFIE